MQYIFYVKRQFLVNLSMIYDYMFIRLNCVQYKCTTISIVGNLIKYEKCNTHFNDLNSIYYKF